MSKEVYVLGIPEPSLTGEEFGRFQEELREAFGESDLLDDPAFVLINGELEALDAEDLKNIGQTFIDQAEAAQESDDCVTFPIEEFRLLVDLAGVSRNPRTDPNEIAPFIGGSARATAARRAHDRAEAVLREAGSDE